MNSQQSFEKAREELEKRLSNKHIRALACLQEKSCENDVLRHRVSELEGYKMKAEYYAVLERQVQSLQVRVDNVCMCFFGVCDAELEKIFYRRMSCQSVASYILWEKMHKRKLSK